MSMFAFGTFLAASNFNIYHSFLSTFLAFALPGQYVMAETLISGGNLLNVFFAVFLTNARLFPMTMHLMPIIRNKSIPKWKYFLISHFIAVTAWINMISKYKTLKVENRYYYFLGLGGFLWIVSLISTLLGFICSKYISYNLLLAMVFFNPLYFLIMTIKNIQNFYVLYVCIISSILSPILYYASKDWGIIIAGLTSGIIVFIVKSLKDKKNDS